MKRLILMVLLIDLALATVLFGWRPRPEPPPAEPPHEARPPITRRVLQQDDQLPWWMRDKAAASKRYSDYSLAVGVGRAATQTLARDAAMLDAQTMMCANGVDNTVSTGYVALEEHAVERDGRWTVFLLAGRQK